MKKLVLFLAIAMSACLFSKAQSFTEIKGQYKSSINSDIRLYQVTNGHLEEIASSKPTSKGYFGFSFKPEYEGYYVVGFGNNMQPRNNYKLYVKGNDKINLEINDSTYVLVGDNTDENKLLEQWYQFYYPIQEASLNLGSKLTSKEFYALLAEKNKQINDWFKSKTSGNADFDRFLKQTAPYDIASYACEYYYNPKFDSTYYKTPYFTSIDPHQYLNETTPLNLPFGLRLTYHLLLHKSISQKGKLEFDEMAHMIDNLQLRGEFVLERVDRIQSYSELDAKIKKYNNCFVTADQKKRVEEQLARLAEFRPGLKGYNFSFPDKNGKSVSLSDLNNKVVLVDVWATWCGPCKQEIPHMKKLEEEFQGKDIAFVSISTDDEKDKEKWKNFITQQKMGGYQLFGGNANKFSTIYKINGIPRFLVFDKKGNIVTVDSPRPSDPKLKELLKSELSK